MGAAAAIIARQRLAHLRLGGAGIFIQQRLRRHDDAGRTEAALIAAVIQESLLKTVQLARSRIGQTFDGGDLRTVAVHGQHHAGSNRLTVHNHRAGAASALIAAELYARQAQAVAQGMHQRFALRHFAAALAHVKFVGTAVYLEGNDLYGSNFHVFSPLKFKTPYLAFFLDARKARPMATPHRQMPAKKNHTTL